MENKQSILKFKQTYISILKKYNGKKLLFKRMHSALTKICKKKNELKNQLFSFTQYESATENLTIGECFGARIICFNYNNLTTGIGRIICFNEFNLIMKSNKYRMQKVKLSKTWEYLKLENFYKFQKKLFEYSEDLTFEQYASGVLAVPKATPDPEIDWFTDLFGPRLFINIVDDTKNRWPNIKWNSGPESVQISRVNNGIELMIAASYKYFTSELFKSGQDN